MIKEYKKNIKQCPNCSTHWTFNDDDVQEKPVCGGFYGDYKVFFIKCPKCSSHLELYNDKGIWK